MMRALLPLALLAAAAAAQAQAAEPFGVRVRLAYGFSSGFERQDGSSGRFEGPEIAVALPIGTFLGREVLLEPSYFGGGRGRKGGDDDADVYRLTAFLHRSFARDLDFRVGVGFAASTRARGGGFSGTSDVIFDFGLAVPLTIKRFDRLSPFVDVHAILSPDDRLGGYFLGVGAKL